MVDPKQELLRFGGGLSHLLSGEGIRAKVYLPRLNISGKLPVNILIVDGLKLLIKEC